MNDLDVIREIEAEIEVPLQRVPHEAFAKRSGWPGRTYAVDAEGNITGLRLEATAFANSTLFAKLPSLSALILPASAFLSDFSFLRELKGLSSLDLSSNRQISDFSFLRELKGLTSLGLNSNNLSDVSFLGELKGLSSLDLSSNKQISDFSFLRELKGLSSLDLSSNKQISDFSFLRELKGLSSLSLSFNNLSDVSFLRELKGLSSLSLSSNNLSDVSFLGELKGLSSLYLRSNNLSDVSFLGELKGLSSLYLSSNRQISDFSFLRELKGLSSLDLSSNNLSDVSFLRELKGLSSLYLGFNNLSDVSFLRELKGLSFLHLRSNKLSDVSFLRELKGLSSLDLSSNKQISDFSFLRELKGLSSLRLGSNNLSDVSFLRELKGLTLLDLKKNNISDISFVTELPRLIHLSIAENRVDEPPEDIVAQGARAIRSYFQERKETGEGRIYEARALLVGEPGAGKTSLMRKLLDHDYVVGPAQPCDSTLGIDIRPNWKFPYRADPEHTFRAHLWDFGGQDIQYYIHQFFLTERALYILLVDDREDCQNIDYWLNIIKVLGKGSPVLLVRNERNIQSATGFDPEKYKKRYTGDFDITYRPVNLAADETPHRFLDIEDRAQRLLCGLEHVGQPLPANWVAVREALAELRESGKNHIPLTEFQQLCAAKKLDAEADRKVLARYLHALGDILYYENDTALGDTVFLNPHWITRAVYTILSDKDLENNGRFSRAWFLERLTALDYDPTERNKILLLMQKNEFDLIYKLDSGEEETYLAPRLLPNEAPKEAHAWQRQGALSFRYRYPFMPHGLISRLMVRLSGLVAESEGREDLVWREGFILNKGGCRALVKEDLTREGLQVIDISVSGEAYLRREMLAHIRLTLEGIQEKSFSSLDYELLVPCCCEVCAQLETPTFFEFTTLRRYVESGRGTITCDNEKSVQDVEISDLLGSVVVPTKEGWREFMDTVQMSLFPAAMSGDIPRTDRGRSLLPIDDRLLDLLEKALEGQGATHIYRGPVGAVTDAGDVNQVNVEEIQPQRKPFLQRTSTLIGIAAAVVTICLGIWQFFFKPESRSPVQTEIASQPAAAETDSTATAAGTEADSVKQTAGKTP